MSLCVRLFFSLDRKKIKHHHQKTLGTYPQSYFSLGHRFEVFFFKGFPQMYETIYLSKKEKLFPLHLFLNKKKVTLQYDKSNGSFYSLGFSTFVHHSKFKQNLSPLSFKFFRKILLGQDKSPPKKTIEKR